MKLSISSFVVAAALAVCGSAWATPPVAPQQLATQKMCLSCHAIDKKVVGPAYKDVAAKYAKQKGAVDQLVERVMKGSGSKLNWGTIPMPANTQVSKAEAEILVKWVLSQK